MTSLRAYLDEVLKACPTLKEVDESADGEFARIRLRSVYDADIFDVFVQDVQTDKALQHGWLFFSVRLTVTGTDPRALAEFLDSRPRHARKLSTIYETPATKK
jgi:hypothetical protein